MVHLGRPRRPLLFLALMSNAWHANALSQEYCSSENTGSSYDAVTNIYQSNGACEEQCVDSYAFAIVQYQQCWCSNYAPADTVDVSECSEACPGYPEESCGDEDNGLYGYIALSLSPSGTQGASSSTSTSTSEASSTSTTESTSSSPSSSSTEESESTIYTSISVTVTVKQTASVSVTSVTASSSESSSTSSTSSTTSTTSTTSSTDSSTSSTSLLITTTQAAAVTSSTASSTSHTTMVSTRVITISGAPVTQTVTSTAVVQPGSDSQKATAENKGISGGTVAGAVVGSVIGVALILAGAFFIWRRRQSQNADPESPGSAGGSAAARRNAKKMERNTSVLSKTGLLSSAAAPNSGEKFSDDPTGFAAAANHRYQNSGSTGPSPTGPGDLTRRDSRPMLYDQRLNPVALMEHWEQNGSRASIGTMQDQRDYSRPLGVTNPDPTDDD